MATKDHFLSFHNGAEVFDTSNNKCINLNLNQRNQDSLNAFLKSSKNVLPEKRKALDYAPPIKHIRTAAATKNVLDFANNDYSQSKKVSHSWNKSSKDFSSNFLNSVYGSENKYGLKKAAHNSSITNSSTLSLHIEAYENSNEDNLFGKPAKQCLKQRGYEKQIFIGSISVIENPFEFPRQHQDTVQVPEVAEFSASQQLLNANPINCENTSHQYTKECITSTTAIADDPTDPTDDRIMGFLTNAQVITFSILFVLLLVLIVTVILFFVCYVNKLGPAKDGSKDKESAQVMEPSSQQSTINQQQEGSQAQNNDPSSMPPQPQPNLYETVGTKPPINIEPFHKPSPAEKVEKQKSPAPGQGLNYEPLVPGITHRPLPPAQSERGKKLFQDGSEKVDHDTSASEKSENNQKVSKRGYSQKTSEKHQKASRRGPKLSSEHEQLAPPTAADPEPAKPAKDSFFVKTKRTTATTQAATKEGSGSKEKESKKPTVTKTQNESDNPLPAVIQQTQATQQRTKDETKETTKFTAAGTMEEKSEGDAAPPPQIFKATKPPSTRENISYDAVKEL